MAESRTPILSSLDRNRLLDLVSKASVHAVRSDNIRIETTARFEDIPACQLMHERQEELRPLEWDPFFQRYESIGKNTAQIAGRASLNFNTYDYLDLNGHPEVVQAGLDAATRFGFSASASRVVGGERPVHRELETLLASIYETEDCVVFVSGHATNVSTLATLFGPGDCIVHDSLAHNSLVQGALLSRAHRLPFPHNDMEALESVLGNRPRGCGRTVIVSEGLFSMDGCLGNLPALIALKKKYRSFLMIDEAHSLGTLGSTGRGVWEHFGLDPSEVDIWMGTLSKTACACGGFIAGRSILVETLKNLAPGFVFSVGMSPPLAVAARTALEIMLREPARVAALQERSRYFMDRARSLGLDTGRAQGHAVAPIMVGGKAVAFFLARLLSAQGVSVMPLAHPAVEENAARLRFFLSASHTHDDIDRALDMVHELLPQARAAALGLP